MCGIITSVAIDKNKFDNSYKVIQQYKDQKSRGRRGFGFVASKDKKLIYCRSKTEDKIIEKLKNLGDTDFIIFHHRLPTSAPNDAKTSHPVKVQNEELDHNYFLIHNGSIRNHDDLKEEHEKLGYQYQTEVDIKIGEKVEKDHNDTESLAIEMARFLDGKQNSMGATGSIACFCLKTDKKTNKPLAIYYFRNTNPINLYRNQAGMFFSSEGKGYELETHKIYKVNLSDYSISEFDLPPKSISVETDEEKEKNGAVTVVNKSLPSPSEEEKEEFGFSVKDDKKKDEEDVDGEILLDFSEESLEDYDYGNGMKYNIKDEKVLHKLNHFFQNYNPLIDVDYGVDIERLASMLSEQNNKLEEKNEELDLYKKEIFRIMQGLPRSSEMAESELRSMRDMLENNIETIKNSAKKLREQIISKVDSVILEI